MQQSLRRMLTGLTLLVGGAEISSADIIIQDQKFGSISASSHSETINYVLFDPSLGTLTNVDLAVTSRVVDPVGTFFDASVLAPDPFIFFTSGGPTTQPTTDLNYSSSNVFLGSYIGVGNFPASFFYFASCPGGCGSDGWSGNLKVTYTYDPPPSQVPLPSTLPLFATGLGALGLLGWRRKRKAAATAA